jgi:hypothetical protein
MIHPERFAKFITNSNTGYINPQKVATNYNMGVPYTNHPETLLQNENVCHLNDVGTICEYNIPTGEQLPFGLGENEGEVFLARDQVQNAVLVASYDLDYDVLKMTIDNLKVSNNSFADKDIPRYDINFYVRHGVLKPFVCDVPRPVGGKRRSTRRQRSTRRRRN